LAELFSTREAGALDPSKSITQYAISSWRTGDGLPVNTVWAMAQTADGHLWLGTEEGLARFDGVRFTVFERANTPSMPGHNVQAMCTGRAGTLWAGTYGNGLLRWDGARFLDWGTRDGLLSDSVNAVAEDRDGVVWIGTERGLNRLAGSRISAFGRREGLPSDVINGLAVGGGGRLWVATDSGIALVVGGALRRTVTDARIVKASILSMTEDAAGRLWIGTDQGLLELDGDRLLAYTSKDGLANDFVRTLLFDRQGTLWIGTSAGLNRMRDGRIDLLTAKDGLSSNLIQSLYEDRDGSLWVATRGGGVDMMKDGDFVTYGWKEGAYAEVIDTLTPARAGGIWVAGWDGRVARLSGGGRFEHLESKEVLKGSDVRALREKGDALYIGAWNGLYAARNGRVTRIHPEESLLNVRAVLEDAHGDLWVGLDTDGLVRFHDGVPRRFTTKDGLGSNQVRALLEDPDGTVWVATYGGLSRFGGEEFTTLTTKDGLPSNLVRCLYRDADGVLWIGTYGGGLARLRKGHVTAFTSHDGLFTDVAYGLVEDGARNLWISSNKGVYRVSKRELDEHARTPGSPIRSIAFGESDGMASQECNGGDPAAARTPDGRLWFATIKGVVTVDPARLRRSAAPPVVLESAIVEGRAVDVAKPLEVRPSARRFEFHYTAPFFLAPQKLEFRYRLEGFDERWIDAGPRRDAYYTNIPPGAYRFRVVAGIDGAFDGAGAAFAFRIAAPWWQRSWARALFALLAAGLVVTAVRVRTRSLEKDRRRLEAAVAARSAELAQANQDLQEAALTDPLTKARNRRFFSMAIDGECELAVRGYRSGAALKNRDLLFYLLDLDSFKEVNDRYGHEAGDFLLVETAKRLARTLRRTDFLIRWGGEEFLIIARASDRREGQAQAERILTAIGGAPYRLGGSWQARTCSVGWAAYPWLGDRPDTVGYEEVLRLADRALYDAKAKGRNCAVGYVAEPGDGTGAAAGETFQGPLGCAVRMVRAEGPAIG
jgi:diguanylate cyclase (GGDEF)-like protein